MTTFPEVAAERAFAREWRTDHDDPAPRPRRPRSRPAANNAHPAHRCVICGGPTPGTYTCGPACLAAL